MLAFLEHYLSFQIMGCGKLPKEKGVLKRVSHFFGTILHNVLCLLIYAFYIPGGLLRKGVDNAVSRLKILSPQNDGVPCR